MKGEEAMATIDLSTIRPLKDGEGLVVSTVMTMDGAKIIGIAIKVDDKDFHVKYPEVGKYKPSLRVGTFPREYDERTLKMFSFPEEIILEITPEGEEK